MAFAASPSWRATTPDRCDAAASCCTISAVLSFAFGPSSQRMSSAARPCFAAHMWSATTATASSRRTTWSTPLIAFALLSSTLASLPPNTGQAATVATFMPGTLTSMPNCAVPLTLSGASKRFADVPISLKSFGSLSGTSRGSGSVGRLVDQGAVAEAAAGRRHGSPRPAQPGRNSHRPSMSAPRRPPAGCARWRQRGAAAPNCRAPRSSRPSVCTPNRGSA